VSEAFHLNNKEAKREIKVKYNNETLPCCSEPKYFGVTLGRSLTYRRVTSQEADITRHAPEAACWLRLGFWSNNFANNHPSPGAFNHRVQRACLVPQCSYLPHRRLANCDWMRASYTSRQPSRQASSQWSHIVSRTSCRGACVSALQSSTYIESAIRSAYLGKA